MLLTEMSSYKNAVQQYGQDAANFWAQYDFSPTKRYVKKMCDLYYIDKVPLNEITKVFRDYQENSWWFDALGINFNQLSWEKLKELVQRHTGEYEDLFKLPNQFFESEDGLITIGIFNTFEDAMNFEPNNGWCTSINQGRFEEHHDLNHENLYIIRNCKFSKGSNCRFVVAQVNPNGSIIFWDQKDNNLNDGGNISAQEYEATLGDAVKALQPMKPNVDNDNYINNNNTDNNNNNKQNINCNKNMNTNRIRLTESELNRIVKESTNRVLKEATGTPDSKTRANLGVLGWGGIYDKHQADYEANAFDDVVDALDRFTTCISKINPSNKYIDAIHKPLVEIEKILKYWQNTLITKQGEQPDYFYQTRHERKPKYRHFSTDSKEPFFTKGY